MNDSESTQEQGENKVCFKHSVPRVFSSFHPKINILKKS